MLCGVAGSIGSLSWYKAYPSGVEDRQLFPCQRNLRNQAVVLLVISGPLRKGTSFSRMLILGPFRTTHSYFDYFSAICPIPVSFYKWMLSKQPSVHAKHQVSSCNSHRDIIHSVLSGGPERTV